MTTEDRANTAAAPVQPHGISHVVLNVRDIERAHAFYTNMLGFRQVGAIEQLSMRFYAGGGGNHHDLALVQLPNPRRRGTGRLSPGGSDHGRAEPRRNPDAG
ncbi:MAG: VOC family protein [Dehalococcoidia bacterium]